MQVQLHAQLGHFGSGFPITRGTLDGAVGETLAQPDDKPGEDEDDNNSGEDDEAVSGDLAAVFTVRPGVEEGVGVEALGVVGQIGEGDIEQEDEHEEGEGQQGMGVGRGEDDLEKGPEGVEAMLGDL